LIEEGKVDPDCKKIGIPAICSASKGGNNKMIEYLLSVGANINAKNMNGQNAIHLAAYFVKLETMKLLVSLGCDFNAKNGDGKTPLQVVQKYGKMESVAFLKQVEQK
jgi:ankyrin repeat protein